uniref:Uncharacterized protein n=1 Tax=Oryza barthii TaxID=65489 RepID=A0A0D3FKR8_9ORYZ
MNPANWKEEQHLCACLRAVGKQTKAWLDEFVLASLAMWGGIFYGVGRLFSGKKEDKTTEAAPAQA